MEVTEHETELELDTIEPARPPAPAPPPDSKRKPEAKSGDKGKRPKSGSFHPPPRGAAAAAVATEANDDDEDPADLPEDDLRIPIDPPSMDQTVFLKPEMTRVRRYLYLVCVLAIGLFLALCAITIWFRLHWEPMGSCSTAVKTNGNHTALHYVKWQNVP